MLGKKKYIVQLYSLSNWSYCFQIKLSLFFLYFYISSAITYFFKILMSRLSFSLMLSLVPEFWS